MLYQELLNSLQSWLWSIPEVWKRSLHTKMLNDTKVEDKSCLGVGGGGGAFARDDFLEEMRKVAVLGIFIFYLWMAEHYFNRPLP